MGKPNISNIFDIGMNSISRLHLSTLCNGTLKAEGKGRRRQKLYHKDTGSQKAAGLFG